MRLGIIVFLLSIYTALASIKLNDNIYPFQNTSLSWDERVDDLVGRLLVDEIFDQLSHGGYASAGPAPAITRLGIGPYSWDTECLHGDVS